MHVVVTGGDGFLGRNLRVALRERGYAHVTNITRGVGNDAVRAALGTADFVFHLAGVNRPRDPAAFERDNLGFTATVCTMLQDAGRRAPIVYASSTQALLDNAYGSSKRAAEGEIERYGSATGAPAVVFRLPNVFGKWCRPNYNSVIATFCHNIARGEPIIVHDAGAPLRLLYIDDLITAMTGLLKEGAIRSGFVQADPVYETTVGEVAEILRSFADSRRTLVIGPVGTGLTRALYATYLSYLPGKEFAYPLERHADARGVFVEVLKTQSFGQFSYFTAGAGVTRGGHYHHSKTEKFLVVKGTARFRFRHVLTGEREELVVDAEAPRIVEAVPGWVHDITNIGTEELVVMLWASEVFDPERTDTIAAKVTG